MSEELLIAAVAAIAGMAVGWGGLFARLRRVERDVEQIRDVLPKILHAVTEIQTRLDDFGDGPVTKVWGRS